MSDRRVVVTGFGTVTALGIGADTLIDGWCAGRSGITDGLGSCATFEPTDFFKKKEIKRFDRYAQFTVVAADEAIAMAGWQEGLPYEADRIGCVVGTAGGGLGTLVAAATEYLEAGTPDAVTALQLMIPRAMHNAAAGILSLRYGLQGPCHAIASFCASGNDAIADGIRMLRLGETDAMLVGGADAGMHEFPLQSWRRMGVLSESGVPRPFDARRDGFVLGEGAGVLVLEAAELAERRGAPIFGEILGYGATQDAYDIVTPRPDARGAIQAIEDALADAGVQADEIDYVNAQGTATRDADRAETLAIKQALGARARAVPVSALKSSIGHSLGGAGTVEAIATLLALQRGVAPPTLNYEVPEEGLDLDYVPDTARPLAGDGSNGTRRVALANSFGFGGHNNVLVLAAG